MLNSLSVHTAPAEGGTMNGWIAMLARNAQLSIIATAWCMLFLLCATNQAYAQPPDDCLRVKKLFTSYDALRQGTEFDVHVTLGASGCALSVPMASETMNSRLLLKGDSGFQVRLTGRDLTGIERLSEGPPVIYGAHEATLYLRLAAAQDVPPGLHHPHLPIAYETVDPTGRRVLRNTEIEIPVLAVVHDAPVKMQSDAPKWNPLELLLIPFRLIELLFWDGC
jgi:hypothetical protein